MPAAQIDKRYYDSPYYIFPNDNVGQEAFAVIRDAMKGKGVVALGRIVLNKRERVIALEPFGKGLLGTTLHYAYEVRDASDYFDDIADIKMSGEMLKLAEHILATKSGEFDPAQFQDQYETALVEMLRQKQAGFKPPKTKEKPAAPNVVNLMDALRQSIAAGRRTPAAGKAAARGQGAGVEEIAQNGCRPERDAVADRRQEDEGSGEEGGREAGRKAAAGGMSCARLRSRCRRRIARTSPEEICRRLIARLTADPDSDQCDDLGHLYGSAFRAHSGIGTADERGRSLP